MRRLWLLVMALAMLGQWSYAAAGAYCAHEGGRSPAAAHWGHHFHAHAGHEKPQGPADAKAGFDGDCAFCHAGCAFSPAAPLSSGVGTRVVLPEAAAPSHPAGRDPDTPERPQWRMLALA